MDNRKKIIFNEIYIMFYKWIELNIKLNIKDLRDMFTLLIQGDKRYIRYCDERIEKDIFALEKVLTSMPDKYKKLFYNLIICCIDLYTYDSITEHKKILQMDMLYYKYIISRYFIDGYRSGNLDKTKFSSFKDEFYQIGVIIKQYYQNKEEEKKSTIANMIKSKTAELFKRHQLTYSLPPCCM